MFNHQPLVTDLQHVQLESGLQVDYLSEAQLAGSGRQHAATSDLMLDTREEGEQLFAAFTYATDIFDAATIAAMAGHWRNILVSVCRDPQQFVGDVALLADTERKQLIQATASEPDFASVQTLFEAQCAHAAGLRR